MNEALPYGPTEDVNASWEGNKVLPLQEEATDSERRKSRAKQSPRRDKSNLSLPVRQHRSDIIHTLHKERAFVISGATGSGKSTQVPQFVLEELVSGALGNQNSTAGKVFCCQPRRISATSIAARVAQEWGAGEVGGIIGYSVKLESKVSSETKLVFCTTVCTLRIYLF
jgi:HrpA-like RNA helicase